MSCIYLLLYILIKYSFFKKLFFFKIIRRYCSTFSFISFRSRGESYYKGLFIANDNVVEEELKALDYDVSKVSPFFTYFQPAKRSLDGLLLSLCSGGVGFVTLLL